MSGSDMDSLSSEWDVVETEELEQTADGDENKVQETKRLSEENRKPTRKDHAIETKDRKIAKLKEKGQSEKRKSDETIKHLEQEIERLKCSESDRLRLLEETKRLEGLLQTENEQKRDLEKHLDESSSSYKILENAWHQVENDYRSLQKNNVNLKEANQKLEEEKNNLLLRLSKIAGAKLTYENPNIADLSDKKRPTKLAEDFAELYDNEWTDAFENVNSDNENEKTAFLLKLLQRANEICREVSLEHIERIKRSLCTLTVCNNSPIKRPYPEQENDNIKRLRLSDQEEHNGHSTVSEVSFDYSSLQSDQKKTVMELKKFIEFGLVNDLVKMVTDKIIDEFSIDRDTQGPLLTYISICVQICWSMCQVEPPVFIDFSKEPGDMCFDTAIYKPYTKSGKFVDFVVWPAVHLHENGPLLCKGVAQGRN